MQINEVKYWGKGGVILQYEILKQSPSVMFNMFKVISCYLLVIMFTPAFIPPRPEVYK